MDHSDDFVVRYTNKDIMNKLDKIHREISLICVQQARINGRVKLHAKLLYFMGGAFLSIIGWLLLN